MYTAAAPWPSRVVSAAVNGSKRMNRRGDLVSANGQTLIETQPDQARQLLQSKPQLAYALFQAMLLMNIVDASVLQVSGSSPVYTSASLAL